MKAGAPSANSRKSREREIVPSTDAFKRLKVVTGAESPTLSANRPRLSASFGGMLPIRSVRLSADSGNETRLAVPADIRQALPSETGEPSSAAAIVFDKIPLDFVKTVISTSAEVMAHTATVTAAR
jgi:hypothetical protein